MKFMLLGVLFRVIFDFVMSVQAKAVCRMVVLTIIAVFTCLGVAKLAVIFGTLINLCLRVCLVAVKPYSARY